MAETSGPFDGSPWAQSQWYDTAPAWAPSAVIGSPASTIAGGSLGLSINGLNLTLAVGQAIVRGAGYKNTTTKALTVAPNTNTTLSRWDRIVLRRDLAAKTVTAVLLQGTPAASPVAVAPTEVDAGIWDVPLFSFLVPPNSGTTLTSIRDERIFVDRSGQLAVYSSATLSYLSATPNGARVWAENPGLFYDRMGGTWIPAPWADPASGRVLRWTGAQSVKVGGPRELLYENGNWGSSGWIAAGQNLAVLGADFSSPVAADTAHVHFSCVMQAAAATSLGNLILTVAGVAYSQLYNVDTGGGAVVIEMPVSVPAGAVSVRMTVSASSGEAVFVAYSALRVTI